jgi:hypothetical protein
LMAAASGAGMKAGLKAGTEEAMRAVQRIALETACKAARERILAMASKRQIKLSSAWKPTSLIAIIALRTDLSDADKIKLAARAKMEGNLSELLPEKYTGASRRLSTRDDPLDGKLKFKSDGATVESTEDPTQKWSTVNVRLFYIIVSLFYIIARPFTS